MKHIFFNTALCLAIIISVSCSGKKNTVSSPLMGTIVNLTIYREQSLAAKGAQAAFDEIHRIEIAMSPYIKNSDVTRINTNPTKFVTVSGETLRLIKQSIAISNDTGGAFDISFASIAHLWNYKDKHFRLPSLEMVNRYKKYVNYQNIVVRDNQVKLNGAHMKIGLGGIAKGYAIKRAVEVLKQQGMSTGIVEAGGDLQVFGRKGFFDPWRTGVMHPRKKSILMIVDLEDMDSIATSGDYERVVMYNGKRYHHIIDPRTGYPADTFASVSVISKDPVMSDAYATALFVMGLERAKQYLHNNSEIQAVFVDLDMKVYASLSLKGRIELTDEIDINWMD